MACVAFDIETVGWDLEELDEATRENLMKRVETPEDEEEVRGSLNFYPITAQIVTVAMVDCDSGRGSVFFQSPGSRMQAFQEGGAEFIPGTEEDILRNFWERMRGYSRFVTFNGRGFDCPFLLLRSGIKRIKPTRELMPNRYDARTHVDLCDQLSFYGAFRRRFGLDMWCRAFGIKSPKEEGVQGDQVKGMFQQGQHLEIARYCLRDVHATRELFAHWEKFIKPCSF